MNLEKRLREAGPIVAGWGLLALGFVIVVAGYVRLHGWERGHITADFYANVGVTLIGTAIVVLIIDRLNQARAAEAAREGLIRDMASSDNGLAVRAARELRVLGKVVDGSLDNTDFSRANLEDGSLEMLRARNARFQGCRLARANMSRGDLIGAGFNRADLSRCNLEMAELANTSFVEATLVGVDLGDAILVAAVLSGATATGADFRGSDLRRAKLDGADLTNAKMTGAKIGGASIDRATKLPPGAPPTIAGTKEDLQWPENTIWP